MSDWPDGMAVDPIGDWPGVLTVNRVRSNFSATWTQTLDLLDREMDKLGGTELRLQVAIPASQFRLDGRPRATAKAEHPGVILTLQSKHGALSYPCDTFDSWQDNVRAIALALEALRKVDRYGVTRGGEQYRGFLAIEAGPSSFPSEYAAWLFIKGIGGYDPDETPTRRLVRDAKRISHPDNGGNLDTFQRVMQAEQYLTQKGALG